jgi:hypothetical protein
LNAARRDEGSIIRQAIRWARNLLPLPFGLALAAALSPGPSAWLTVTLVLGLLAFGFVFAINSSVHSYLILAFAKEDRVTLDVGFY